MPKRNREEIQEDAQESPKKRQKIEGDSLWGKTWGLLSGYIYYTASHLKNAVVSGNVNEVHRIVKSVFRPSWSALLAEDPDFLINAGGNPEILKCLLENYGDKIGSVEKEAAWGVFLNTKNIEALLSFSLSNRPHTSEAYYLVSAMRMLLENNVSFQDHEPLYQSLIDLKSIFKTEEMVNVFLQLWNIGITCQGYEPLCQSLIESKLYAKYLAKGCLLLWKAGITYQGHELLYQSLMESKLYAEDLAEGCLLLWKAGITYQGYEPLYQILLNCKVNHIYLAEKCLLLWNIGITYQSNEILYRDIMDDFSTHIKIENFLKLLDDLGVPRAGYAQYFNQHLYLNNHDLAIYVLNQLKVSGYGFKLYPDVLDVHLKILCSAQPERMKLTNLTNELCSYANDNRLLSKDEPGFDAQQNDLSLIIANAGNCKYTAGPLDKAKATIEIERLLSVIVEQDNSGVKYNEFGHYILTMPDKPDVNLSLLIKNANLSQLILSDELIGQLGNYLRIKLGDKWSRCAYSQEMIIRLLPAVEQKAITIYISAAYRNINKLFRTEKLDSRDAYKFVNEDDKGRLVYFLLGCLLNDAVNKLKYLPDQSVEKQCLEKISRHYNVKMSEYVEDEPGLISLSEKSLRESVITIDEKERIQFGRLAEWYPSYTLLDRGEKLTEEDHNRRKANVWRLPALTSFSASKTGSPYFQKGNTTRTKLEIGRHYPIVNPDEGEIILPLGEQVLTTEGPEGLSSKIINSPLFEQHNHYRSDLALADAFKHHLTKEYSGEKSVIIRNGVEIVRPNHNVTHTYRVMLGVDLIIDYFSEFAEDSKFKAFCGLLSDPDVEWLRVAAAFSITGRESEIAAIENLALYDTYRQASAQHCEDFIRQTRPDELVDVLASIVHVLRYMGNPNYECAVNQAVINDISDEVERSIRNFCHRILTIAHKLDLPRCYSADQYANSMKACRDLSVKSEAQQNKLNEIMSYMMQVTKAHGGRLSCDMQPDGTLVNVDTSYQPIYAESSTSLKRLFEITETVPKPSKYLGEFVTPDSLVEIGSCSIKGPRK